MLNRAGSNSVRRVRAFGAASAPLFVLTAVVFVVPVLSGGAAAAGVSPPVPVAGVPAFGIGAGQVGGSPSSGPAGIAIDSKGDLFVADQADNRVEEYTPSSPTSYPQVGVTVAGAGGQGSGLNQLYYPSGVALDAKGDLFVSDSSQRPRRRVRVQLLNGHLRLLGDGGGRYRNGWDGPQPAR